MSDRLNFADRLRMGNEAIRLESENDKLYKLYELVCMFAEYLSQDHCEGCVVKRRCNDGEVDECWQLAEIRKASHEFGIEVD